MISQNIIKIYLIKKTLEGLGINCCRWAVAFGFIQKQMGSFSPWWVFDNWMTMDLYVYFLAGEAKIGLIYEDELGERWLKTGDVYHIPAGSAFYLVNTAEGQKLHVICSIDPSEGLGVGTFQVIG